MKAAGSIRKSLLMLCLGMVFTGCASNSQLSPEVQASIISNESGGLVLSLDTDGVPCPRGELSFEHIQTGDMHTARLAKSFGDGQSAIGIISVPSGTYRLLAGACTSTSPSGEFIRTVESDFYAPESLLTLTVENGQITYPGGVHIGHVEKGQRLSIELTPSESIFSAAFVEILNARYAERNGKPLSDDQKVAVLEYLKVLFALSDDRGVLTGFQTHVVYQLEDSRDDAVAFMNSNYPDLAGRLTVKLGLLDMENIYGVFSQSSRSVRAPTPPQAVSAAQNAAREQTGQPREFKPTTVFKPPER